MRLYTLIFVLFSISLHGQYAAQSVLATGTWYQFNVTQPGMHVITYEDLKSNGVAVASIDPRNIRLYSNGGGMLPEANSAPRIDDLMENAIRVAGEEDGVFGEGDYILFYGEGQEKWSYHTQDQLFTHQKNIYSDHTCYFLTWDKGPGKRISAISQAASPPSHTITTFNDFASYEVDDLNLIKSGREWYDHAYFDVTTQRSYAFDFPQLDLSVPVFVKAVVAGRSTAGSSSFTVAINGSDLTTISIPSVSSEFLATYARERTGTGSLKVTGSSFQIDLTYNKPNPSAIGYLNYIEINVNRHLSFNGGQLAFRSVASAGPGKISDFRITTQGQQLQVWEVSQTGMAQTVTVSNSGTISSFRIETPELMEFVAFDGTSYLKPAFAGRVENQDLHGVTPPDYVIISYSSFLPQAERLADFHRDQDGFSVFVTTVDKVYREFSGGVQDLSAIRDFMRMLKQKGGSSGKPRYLLLFGDASYDYKNRSEVNTNLVPAYQSPESLDPIESYVTDDFFVLLDANEGQGTGGTLDMGVGRLPVFTTEEAISAVDKILHYSTESQQVKNDWRNIIAFVGDDEDGNLHMEQADQLGSLINAQHPVYNVDKIFVDAYQQLATPGGQRAPEINETINRRVDKGALIVNYTGHGGEVGWAHERILEIADIQGWNNMDNMPVFVTATCEFSRYDDPDRVSAGEMVFLNPSGGGIALFTTTRPTFAGSNFALSSNFYQIAFNKVDGEYLRMGDLILISKNNTSSSANTRKFVLLGDPALKMSYPKQQVITTSLNGVSTWSQADTLKALSEITITGEVLDLQGNLDESFNGEVFPTVYDKPAIVQTLGSDGGNTFTFELMRSQIYKGKAAVSSGKFSFSFIVPKDISYNFGHGKISYYARNDQTDANGYSDELVVGGYNDQAMTDNNGPELDLYMNDRSFVDGGITNQSPFVLADVRDESGINTVGNGIGHDITLVLDDDTRTPWILNDYYVSNVDTYRSGTVTFPLFDLEDGRHSVTLKLWDVYNNSTEKSLSFLVVSSAEFKMLELFNYPNPFKDQTTFSFQTNQTGQEFDVEIMIFSLYGELVKSLQSRFMSTGFRIDNLKWDGTNMHGSKVPSGLYVYKAIATLPDGAQVYRSGKLIFNKQN